MAKLGKYEKARILPANAVAMMDRACKTRDPRARQKAMRQADREVRCTYPQYFRDNENETDIGPGE